MDKESITLVTIAADPNGGLSPVQLQKSLFIVGKSSLEGLPADYYEFSPYNYGPFTSEVYSITDTLEREGLVRKIIAGGENFHRYVLTPQGRAKAAEVRKDGPSLLCDYIETTVRWVCSLSFDELLRAIYAKYPDYAINSIFQE
jgi:uncharacterized protein YwgA